MANIIHAPKNGDPMKQINHPLIPLTFLNELAAEENHIHPMNSIRMQQGIKKMFRNLIILCCLLLLWFFSDAVLANEKPYTSLWNELNQQFLPSDREKPKLIETL